MGFVYYNLLIIGYVKLRKINRLFRWILVEINKVEVDKKVILIKAFYLYGKMLFIYDNFIYKYKGRDDKKWQIFMVMYGFQV